MYREEYGDDYTEGATSHTTLYHLLCMANIELLVLYFIVMITLFYCLDGLYLGATLPLLTLLLG